MVYQLTMGLVEILCTFVMLILGTVKVGTEHLLTTSREDQA